ncbi:MAG: hypothetical protein BRC43_15035 [Cyanobacteria bacterium QS_3_48_167]|nr:MAG: hypothetical protein BRC43_15035 [Cyanobacteria bacterium QS_3_48_167]
MVINQLLSGLAAYSRILQVDGDWRSLLSFPQVGVWLLQPYSSQPLSQKPLKIQNAKFKI